MVFLFGNIFIYLHIESLNMLVNITKTIYCKFGVVFLPGLYELREDGLIQHPTRESLVVRPNKKDYKEIKIEWQRVK